MSESRHVWPPGRHVLNGGEQGVVGGRDRGPVLGLDVHKKTVMATVRTPDGLGGRAQATREFATFTGRLIELRDWFGNFAVSGSLSSQILYLLGITSGLLHLTTLFNLSP